MPTPFFEKEFTFSNPDGTTIQVKGSGNQYYAVFETLDGYTVVKDPKTGFYKYAQLSEDKNELRPIYDKIGEVDPHSLGLRPHIRIRRESAKQKAMTSLMRDEQRSRWRIRRQGKISQLRETNPSMGPEAMSSATATVGNYVGLCILIRFPDVAETISQSQIDNFCNQPGYDGFGNNGSVKDYFHDNSRGKLIYTNIVTQYYTAAHERSHYTDKSVPFGTRVEELVLEALDDLKAKDFDFSQLSSDIDGYIHALNIFYVGPLVNCYNEGLWPNSSDLTVEYDVGDSLKFKDYQITNIGDDLTLFTFCHENGHMICDFPDLVDYGLESAGIGHYCLMGYGGGDEKDPVQVCAYLKNIAGWATKVDAITPGMTATLNAANNEFYIYDKNGKEYFIIENRSMSGRDKSLPDAGLAIWHVDEDQKVNGNNNEQMTATQHYECSLEQADNLFELEMDPEKFGNYGDSGDLFGNPNDTEFSDDTTPNSKWWDGSNSGLKITNISAPGETMSFSVEL